MKVYVLVKPWVGKMVGEKGVHSAAPAVARWVCGTAASKGLWTDGRSADQLAEQMARSTVAHWGNGMVVSREIWKAD
jgi:hypothetical protein